MLTAGARLGTYEILEFIGAGGMGEVYRAKDTRLDREVAIKILKEQMAIDPFALKRFEREAKTVAALSHPNILDIHEFDTQGGVSFFVTELLKGETLRQRITRSSLALEKGLEISAAVAEGLAAAHSNGVVHRDLKPENIFVTNDGRVKILDFGLARLKPVLSEQELTQAETKSLETQDGIIRGTIPYMSPEQVRGGTVDIRTDIFSFGCVLYEMFTGKRAFSRETPADTVSAILNEDPIIKDVPVPVQELVQRCLEKNPDQRFQSAHDVVFALKAVLSGSKFQSSEKSKLWARPSMWLSAIAIVLLGILLWWKLSPSFVSSNRYESIAVLPMANLSGDPQQEYFSDGMTDALITDLTSIKALRVISRTSVMQYKGTKKPMSQIAKELNVDAVVEGTVLRSGDRVRITAQLIDAATDAHLWAEAYDRDMQNVLALQSDVARAIVNEIHVQLTPQEQRRLTSSPEVNPEAHEAYLKAQFYLNQATPGGRGKTIEYFTRAVEIDPNYAAAWAGLAQSYATQGASEVLGMDPRQAISTARNAAMKAIQLDPNLGAAHMALGLIHLVYDWDWQASERELKQALDLTPSDVHAYHWYSHLMIVLGRKEESLAASQRALQIDPLNAQIDVHLGWHFLQTHEYDRAIEACLKMLDIYPESVTAYEFLARAYVEKGLFQKAIENQEKSVRFSQRNQVSVTRLGFIYARAGRKQETFNILKELEKIPKESYFAFFELATIYAALGKPDEAFTLLEKAYEFRSVFLPYLKVDPRLDSLHSDPRFDNLVRRVGIP